MIFATAHSRFQSQGLHLRLILQVLGFFASDSRSRSWEANIRENALNMSFGVA